VFHFYSQVRYFISYDIPFLSRSKWFFDKMPSDNHRGNAETGQIGDYHHLIPKVKVGTQ